jgi:hypothetical protein
MRWYSRYERAKSRLLLERFVNKRDRWIRKKDHRLEQKLDSANFRLLVLCIFCLGQSLRIYLVAMAEFDERGEEAEVCCIVV